MRLNIVKSKNAEQLYIIKSFRKHDGKTSSKIMKKLGSVDSLLPLFDNDRDKVIDWAKDQARIMTEEENNSMMQVSINVSELKRNNLHQQLQFNCGYLFLKKIYHQLAIDDICASISNKYKFQYDLSDILSTLIFTRITDPSSKKSSLDAARSYLEQPTFQLHDIYRSLDILAMNSNKIQAKLYENSLRVVNRNTNILYYDCTNFFFEIEEEKGMRKYGKSKENRPNPIVQMGLFLDGNGFPLALTLFPGNASEQPTLKPLEKRIIKDFHQSKFIVCTDAGIASNENRRFNTLSNRSFIVTQSIKKLKEHIKEWALSPEGWKLEESDKTYNINEIDEDYYSEYIFYKERWINENNLKQRLIVTYSIKYKKYQEKIRNQQIERAQKIVEKNSTETRNLNSPIRFVKEVSVTQYGEVANQKVKSLSYDKVEQEKRYDGFYAVCTTLEDNVKQILKINKYRWHIEDSFRTMKKEFKARPVNLQKDNRIEAHFLTCFIALLIMRILESKLENKFTTEEIINTLRRMQLHKLEGYGYLSSYERTELTDKLHEISQFHTDIEFISNKTMKKILGEVKKH